MGGLMSGIEKSINANITDIVNHANNTVLTDIYKLNDEYFDGYQWIAALDNDTCLVCANLDNKIFDRLPNMDGEGTAPPDEPPLHHNCRCIMVPVLEGMRDDPSQTALNYKDWFNEQDKETQLDILGPARYKEYVNGKAVTSFARDGKIKTLKELGVDRITRKELLEQIDTIEKMTTDNLNEIKNKLMDIEDLPVHINKFIGNLSDEELNRVIEIIRIGGADKVRGLSVTSDGIINNNGIVIVSRDNIIDIVKATNLNFKPQALKNPYEIIAEYITKGERLTDAEKTEFKEFLKNSITKNFPKKKLYGDDLEKYTKNIIDQFDVFPPQLQRALFETRPEILYTRAENKAYFLPEDNTITLSAEKLFSTKEGARDFFHELGHALDSRLSIMTGGSYFRIKSPSNVPSLKFYDSFKYEFDKYTAEKEKQGLLQTISVLNKDEKTNPLWNDESIGASDLFRGFSKSVYGGKQGHDRTYYNQYTIPAEGFAHLVSEYAQKVGMGDFFPETLKLFELWLKTGKLT
jgi:hypothetical protein